ncbi:YceI family protein [Parasediminibacterium sp. JCM 36343]|uniref:YceI family protein n=1 Tax=Parasediminibacterium sp. JCM 36343 TaxID=3374279 RepID=UPI00397A52AC
MLKTITLFASLLIASFAIAQSYTPADNGSSVKFVIKNLGFNVDGSFTGLRGSINYVPDNPTVSTFNVSVDANSVNTGNGKRDTHLKKDEYFDAAKYSTLHFISYKITKSASGELAVTGIITIKGVSKEINFPFTVTQQEGGIVLKGSFKLNRRDFNVGGSSMVLSDNLVVDLVIFGKKK